MVGMKGEVAENQGLAIDDAIAYLDSLIGLLQTPSSRSKPVEKEEFKPEVPLPKQKYKEAGVSVVDTPRKKNPKLPGATAATSAAKSSRDSEATVATSAAKSSRESEATAATSTPKSSSESEADYLNDFDKVNIQVAKVVSVEDHPVAEKLYVCKVELAKGEIRQVVAGLRKLIPVAELQGKKVCVVLNLKPAKLAGQLSQAMILAGGGQVNGLETVKILEPPLEAAVGDRIFLQGGVASANPVKQLSSKIWEKMVPMLKVEGGTATYLKVALMTSAGDVKVPVLPDGAEIH